MFAQTLLEYQQRTAWVHFDPHYDLMGVVCAQVGVLPALCACARLL